MIEIEILLCVVIICASATVLSIGLYIASKWYNFKLQELEYDRHVDAMNAEYDPQTDLILLDIFIKDCFNLYLVTSLLVNESYINEEKEVKILNDFGDLINNRISNTLRYRMTQYYSETSLDSVIAEKIYATVATYVASHNKPM